MPLLHLAARLYGTPLLIAPQKLDIILSVLNDRLWGDVIHAETMPHDTTRMMPGLLTAESAAWMEGGVSTIAYIPIHGSLVRRTVGLEAASGLVSYAQLSNQLQTALNDPQIAGILLDIDSSGGEAGGVFELATQIRAATAVKPVWAHVNDAGFSAAYALACAASRVSLSQTAGVGSIGVIALHVDQSVKDAKEGLSYRAIYAGAHKNDLSSHAPLSPQATKGLQQEVNRLYELFVNHVATMRQLSPERIRATQAQVYFGEDALTHQLADQVCSLETVVSDFRAYLATQATVLTTPSFPLAAATMTADVHPSSQEIPMSDITPLIPQAPVAQQAAIEPVSYTASHPDLAPLSSSECMNAVPDASATEPHHTPSPTLNPTLNPALNSYGLSQSEALEIADLCLLAGVPERTSECLDSGMNPSQVRRLLLNARAQQQDIQSHLVLAPSNVPVDDPHRPAIGPSAHNILVNAAQKLASSTTPR